jgi:putative hydrolase of the HAD superfamily
MDGTLLDLHYDNHFWLEYLPVHYAKKENIPLEHAHTTLRDMYGSIEGTLDWYNIDYWQKTLNMDIESMKHQVADKITVRANVEKFLQYLAAMDKRIVLLTNAHHKTVAIKFAYTPIEQYFDQIITSHDIGMAKEEDGFWDKLLETENYDAAHSLFIDDNLDVLTTAEKHGIGYLLAIHQPDSKQPPKKTLHFTAIECFTQLMT